MKNIHKILGLALAAGMVSGVTSCKEEFLDVDQYGIVSSDAVTESESNMLAGLISCYAEFHQKTNGDEFKPNLWMGCHPTMDTQATGWDKDWNQQKWKADQGELLDEWKALYKGITNCNDYITTLEELGEEKIKESKVLTEYLAEAKTMRAYYYTWLAQNWGRVPLIGTGETYVNTPTKAKAKDYNEMWDWIIADYEAAKDNLPADWKPFNGEYGRVTKGMCLTYLADAYLWKAFRNDVPATEADENVKKAKEYLKQVIDCGQYELNPSYTTLWDPIAWQKEAIWEEVADPQSWDWGPNKNNTQFWSTFYSACPANGGWGTLYLSWEWYTSFEVGDKRRDGSACTGPVDFKEIIDPITQQPLSKVAKSQYCYGHHPYLNIAVGNGNDLAAHYHYNMNGDFAPSIWSLKYWRTGEPEWNGQTYPPCHVYWKRLANVYLDYAECCFRTGAEAEGWEYIEKIRERAFGYLEDGQEQKLTDTYLPYYQQYLTSKFNVQSPQVAPTSYPIPFGHQIDKSAYVDGKTYYTTVKANLGFNLEVWQVALLQERRKEFNVEWGLRPDLQRSGVIAEHVAKNYQDQRGRQSDKALIDNPWTPEYGFTYSDQKMDMPIPQSEINNNPACEQNPGY